MTEATFTANRLEDALALVKRAFGADAVIVSSRRVSGDTPRFEVTASAGEGFAMLAPRRPPSRQRSATVKASSSASRASTPKTSDESTSDAETPAAPEPITETRNTIVENELDEAVYPVRGSKIDDWSAALAGPSASLKSSARESLMPPIGPADAKIDGKSHRSPDVAGLERLTHIERPTQHERQSTAHESGDKHDRTDKHQNMLERLLVRNELPNELIRELLARSPRVSRSLAEAQSDLEVTLAASLAYQNNDGGHPRITALVGPTGVGKTTTIAKLAARDALIERKRVVLVSTDNYRIAGAEQLEQYANLIGIPCEIACDGPSLASILVRHAKADRIFIDTAGRAPRDRDAIVDMAEMLASPGWPVEIHLCLAAAMRSAELKYALAQHEPLNPSALLITKLDEAVAFGGILSAALWSRLPLSYFTTGQRVPEDLELATSARLAGALAGDEVVT